MKARELLKVTLDSAPRAYDPATLTDALQVPNLDQLALSPSWVSLEKLWGKEVSKLGWQFPDNLRLLAAHKNPVTGEYEPRVLTNQNASLGTGLAATGAHEFLFQPVKVGNEYLVDGGHVHLNPVLPETTGDTKPAIVIRLNRVTEMPNELKWPNVLFQLPGKDQLLPLFKRYLYWQELNPSEPVRNDVDARNNVLIDLKTEVPGLNMWISRDQALSMVKDGYKQAFEQIRQAITQGRLTPTRDFHSERTDRAVGSQPPEPQLDDLSRKPQSYRARPRDAA